MNSKGNNGGKSKGGNVIKNITPRRIFMTLGFVFFIFLYFIATVFVSRAIHSQGTISIFGSKMPVFAFAGVFSALANLSIILLVFIFGKIGFVTALVILLGQFPFIFFHMMGRYNAGSFSGMFINILTIVAISIIYINNSRIKKYQEHIRQQIVSDPLTGLPSRFACSETMNRYIKNSEKFVIVSVDMNNLKAINDTMGYEVGDKVLMELASRLSSITEFRSESKRDFLARLGGGEFCLLLRDYEDDNDIVEIIRLYEAEIKRKITIDGYDYFMTANFGYAEYYLDADNESSLYSSADAALHEIKRSGGESNILHYSKELLKTARFLEMERKIRAALQNDSFLFYLQPQFDMSHKLRGFEALARLKDKDGSFISPAEFVPVAEEAGIIDRIDIQIFRKAACFLGELVKKTSSDLILCTNISVKHLMKNNFIEEIQAVLEQSLLPPKNVEIEITESIMIESAEKARQCIDKIRSMGMKVAIDDFGTGYSSLSYLNKFPVNILKIDKSFIDQIDSSESSQKYIEAIISIGHILNLEVVSEGVETDGQLEKLKSIGCDYIQGYIWGKPMPPDDAGELL